MAAVLGLMGAVIGLANWYILIRGFFTRKRESLIPVLGTLFMGLAVILSEWKALKLLVLVLDPWPLYILVGLLLLPFRFLWKLLKKRDSRGGDAVK